MSWNFREMDTITKAGRSVGNGVYRVAGAFARGTRKVLSYVPFLGVAALPPEPDQSKSTGVGYIHDTYLFFFLQFLY